MNAEPIDLNTTIQRSKEMNDPDITVQQFQEINKKRQKFRKSERIYRVHESKVQRFYKDAWENVCDHDQIISFDSCVKCRPSLKKAGSSHLACQFIDLLEQELSVHIQHLHYNLEDMCITGSEHHISNLKVDGYYIDSANKPVVVEFLGDIWHGHPSLWGKKNRWGVEYKSLFQTTQERFLKISQLGYSIVYIWQKDFITRDKTASLPLKLFQQDLQ